MKVDGHLHLFRPANVLPRAVDELVPAARDASLEEFLVLQNTHGVDAAVIVPLGPEDVYLATVLQQHPARFAGIAVASRATEGRQGDCDPVQDLLQRQESVGFHGLRTMWLGDPNQLVTESPMFPVFEQMSAQGLVLWSYLPAAQLVLLEQLVKVLPDVKVVLNHFGFSPQDMKIDSDTRPWFKDPFPKGGLDRLLALATFPQVNLMMSGQYAFSRERPPYADLNPIIRPLVESFEARRTLWASDWPWIQSNPGYGELLDLPASALPDASPDELNDIRGGTALRLFPHLAKHLEN